MLLREAAGMGCLLTLARCALFVPHHNILECWYDVKGLDFLQGYQGVRRSDAATREGEKLVPQAFCAHRIVGTAFEDSAEVVKLRPSCNLIANSAPHPVATPLALRSTILGMETLKDARRIADLLVAR